MSEKLTAPADDGQAEDPYEKRSSQPNAISAEQLRARLK
jgi:hypothetical protein